MSWRALIVATATCLMVVAASPRAFAALSDQIDIVDTLPGSFIDISMTGNELDIGDEDEIAIQTTIGNALVPAGQVIVANNGGVGFAPPLTNLAPENEELPSNDAFGGGQALLPYWDDIGNDLGGVFWEEQNDTLIIQWEDRPVNTDAPSEGLGDERPRVTFQIQIFDASESSNAFFQFIYRDIDGAGAGASATIGYQDGGAGFGDEIFSFNTPGAVGNDTVLTVLPEPSTLLMSLFALPLLRRR